MKKKRKINLKKKLWDIFSKWIRLKNADENGMVKCISCDTVRHWKEIHAGHYIPKSLGLSVYFEELNVHPQCAGCNTFKHGNLAQYALALRRIYGDTILEHLESLRKETLKLTSFDYELMIEDYETRLSNLPKVANG